MPAVLDEQLLDRQAHIMAQAVNAMLKYPTWL